MLGSQLSDMWCTAVIRVRLPGHRFQLQVDSPDATVRRILVMDTLLANLTAFPTVIFSVLMGIAVIYWLFVIIGALDIDLFHVGDAAGHHEVGGHHDSDAGHNPNVILEFLGLGKVPLTIILSCFVFVAWSVCFLGGSSLRAALPGWTTWVTSPIILVAAVIVAWILTGWCMRPLAKLFKLEAKTSAYDLIGKLVVVTSSTVDARFGTARHDAPNGEDMILNVVCNPPHALTRGEQAVVMDYDRATGIYTIAPLPHTRPGFLTSEESPPADSPQPVPTRTGQTS